MTETAHKPVLWTAGDAAAATRGRATCPWRAAGVSIDSRKIEPGDLFVAIQGPNFDGHEFVAQALASGACAAMVSRVPAGVAADAPLLIVEETLAALTDLGRAARARTQARVIGVTGSVGKTGTKEALRHCLSAQGRTFATEGSLNNHWGVPLSLARMPQDSEYAIFELGMNHAGELGPLSRLVRPEVAIITNVEAVHLEFFNTVESIADAKAEIFEGMDANGTAVLNRDNPHFAHLVRAARRHGLTRVLGFGSHGDAEARLIEYSLHATCSAVTAVFGSERIQYSLSLPGKHWVMNSLGVLLAVRASGGDLATAARALSTLQPVKGRGTRKRVQLAHGAFTLIDESYNASPVSVAASIEVLGKVDPGASGRRIAVLGDMRELGAKADALHAGLITPLRGAHIDTVYCCGPHMRALWERLPAAMRGKYANDSKELAPLLAADVRGGDVVLVKGSAGSRMGLVVEALATLEHRPEDTRPQAAANGQRG
ncbi:MAG TPA: UDP-N-acetylmuramoylalanyl-D-glutamyl-2,6-diaminopimelate--D-alanyl-D-alanine ligase [Azospirillum sp.]|nr:UDP-N-acetylmuramoylalanyl-D-glutamyl-2,6-diaminopimelate--D-alanyl-D-alanine ligase [Azospirillum sp.]